MKYNIKLTCILPGYGLREPEDNVELTLTDEQEAAQILKGSLERLDPAPQKIAPPMELTPLKPAPVPHKAKAPEKKCHRTRKS